MNKNTPLDWFVVTSLTTFFIFVVLPVIAWISISTIGAVKGSWNDNFSSFQQHSTTFTNDSDIAKKIRESTARRDAAMAFCKKNGYSGGDWEDGTATSTIGASCFKNIPDPVASPQNNSMEHSNLIMI